MTALAAMDWISHPLAGPLLRFNLLPSRLFHPTRRHEWLPARLPLDAEADAVHRHASAGLLRRLDLPMVDVLDAPALPLCMAPDALFERLTLCCGLVPIAPALRRVILRADVEALRADLDDMALHFARGPAARLWTPAQGEAPMLGKDVGGQAMRLGAALLALAMAAAPAAIAGRGRLRLPADAEAANAELPASLRGGDTALALARSVLQELDAAWLSSFPLPR